MYNDTKGIARSNEVTASPYGMGEWTDEWYIIHPDGTHIRKVKLYTNHGAESQSWVTATPRPYVHELEGMYFWNAGRDNRLVEDDLQTDGLTLIKMNETDTTISFNPYPLTTTSNGLDIFFACG